MKISYEVEIRKKGEPLKTVAKATLSSCLKIRRAMEPAGYKITVWRVTRERIKK